MAKINTGTITVAGNGTWSSNAISLSAGAKRLYLRQNGTPLAGYYRDFTATLGIESGFPKVTTYAAQSPIAALVSPTFSTAGASMIVAAITYFNDAGSGSYNTVPMTVSGGGLSWTSAQAAADENFAAAATVWYAYSSGALSSVAITADLLKGANFTDAIIAVYSISGASSTIGASSGKAATTPSSNVDATFTAAAGSVLIWAGMHKQNATALTMLGNTTQDAQVGVASSQTIGHLTALSTAGSVTFGSSYNSANYCSVGIEVKA
jgi:hypothetical protein